MRVFFFLKEKDLFKRNSCQLQTCCDRWKDHNYAQIPCRSALTHPWHLITTCLNRGWLPQSHLTFLQPHLKTYLWVLRGNQGGKLHGCFGSQHPCCVRESLSSLHLKFHEAGLVTARWEPVACTWLATGLCPEVVTVRAAHSPKYRSGQLEKTQAKTTQ